jgi:hypothetical protein
MRISSWLRNMKKWRSFDACLPYFGCCLTLLKDRRNVMALLPYNQAIFSKSLNFYEFRLLIRHLLTFHPQRPRILLFTPLLPVNLRRQGPLQVRSYHLLRFLLLLLLPPKVANILHHPRLCEFEHLPQTPHPLVVRLQAPHHPHFHQFIHLPHPPHLLPAQSHTHTYKTFMKNL